jgi:hypothetical protein
MIGCMTKKPAVVLAVALAALLGPALTACGANPVETVVEGAVEQAGGGDVDLNSDGGLPDGFPEAEVPLYDGEIVGGMGAGSVDSGGGWTVIVRTGDDREADFAAIDAQLTEAGYSGFLEGVGSGAYSDEQYSVIVSVADDGSGQSTATYIVGGTS